MKYFTSDLHLGHLSILKHRDVPVETIPEYDAWVLDKIYDIPKGSDLYILGDIAFTQEGMIKLLAHKPKSVQLHLIHGNHDKSFVQRMARANKIPYHEYLMVKDLNHKFFLCHYPLKVWDCSHYNSINLYGHIHNGTPDIIKDGRQLNVNCEFWGYKPISSEQVIEKLDGIDNWDYLEVKAQRQNRKIML